MATPEPKSTGLQNNDNLRKAIAKFAVDTLQIGNNGRMARATEQLLEDLEITVEEREKIEEDLQPRQQMPRP